MKKLFNLLMLPLALVLPFAAFAQEESKKTTAQVVNENEKSPVEWVITAEETEEEGIFTITFDATIEQGYHGYAMSAFSAPYFAFDGEEEGVVSLEGAMTEPLTPVEHLDSDGSTSMIYYQRATYVQKIKANPGQTVTGFVQATICTNETNQCTNNPSTFTIVMPTNGWMLSAEIAKIVIPATETEEQKEESGFTLTFTRNVNEMQAEFGDQNLKKLIKQAKINCVDREDIVFDDKNSGIKDGWVVLKTKPFVSERGDQLKGEVTISEAKFEFDITLGKKTGSSDSKELDWGSLLEAILWGFAALLTPCVFPMVPMTVSFFVKGSQTPAQGRFRALMYGFFIIALYVLPIAALVILSNVFGTNAAADVFNVIGTHWIPNLIFFAIFMVFAASFFGAFEITMPSKLVNKSDAGADKGGLIGIFFMALTLVLVSFSCTGPIVGSVIISSTSGGNIWMPIFTMAAFAIAFALPFTLLAWFPSLLKNLPKSGGWLNSVKVVLGFIEIALGLKFLMTADQTMHWGLLDREIYLAIWIVTFTLLGFYLLGKIQFAHDDKVEKISVFRLTLAIGVFSFVVYLIPGMFGAPLKGISGYIPPMSTQDYQIDGSVKNVNAGRKYAEFLHLPHNLPGHFDLDEAIEEATKLNKPIFVDVTGHACNNCREMETYVWSDDQVLPKLENEFVICALYVDDNNKADDGQRLGTKNSKLAADRWGVNAQPGYIILSPDGETVLAGPRGYDTNVGGFVAFLNDGLNATKPIYGNVKVISTPAAPKAVEEKAEATETTEVTEPAEAAVVAE